MDEKGEYLLIGYILLQFLHTRPVNILSRLQIGRERDYNISNILQREGYEIADVLVDGKSIGAVSSYTFESVKEAHNITATFKKIAAITNPFADANSSDWFYNSILYVCNRGLMTGTTADTFSPHTGMTRAMAVTVLYRLSGDIGSYANAFTDISSGSLYERTTAWAAANGIANGTGNGRFAPNSTITREQLAVMLYNYAKYMGYDVSVGENTNILSYNDALGISEYAYAALQWACGAGILEGDTNGNLNPQSFANRAEVATMLQRFIENLTD